MKNAPPIDVKRLRELHGKANRCESNGPESSELLNKLLDDKTLPALLKAYEQREKLRALLLACGCCHDDGGCSWCSARVLIDEPHKHGCEWVEAMG